jgi:SAM-dependent methyltransferase
LVDLQLLTIYQYLSSKLHSLQGRVLDVGAGQAPWRELLSKAEYVGVDVDTAGSFGMRRKADVSYYDGKHLPFGDGSFDHVLCTEVLEHVPETADFLLEIKRVLRQGGTLILTVPWSARLHHLPNDYYRFTPAALDALLVSAGFEQTTIVERGNDIAVIANKLLVLLIRLLRPHERAHILWTWIFAVVMVPVTIGFLVAAHAALLLRCGSREDPLGYGVSAVKR